MGGKGGRRGGSAALPGSPPHLPAAGMMPPRLLLPPLPGSLLPANAANAGTADMLGRQYSPPLAIAPLLLRQLLLLLLQLPWGIGVCVGICRRCHHHCHGGSLEVIVAPSTAVAAAVGGGRTCMIAS